MSFTENPYRFFEFFTTSDGSHVARLCSSCGGESVLFPVDTPMSILIDEQRAHVKTSHMRAPETFADWSTPDHRDKDISTDVPTPAQRLLADYLSEYAYDVVVEWMRIVDIDDNVTEPGSPAIQARANWQGGGTFTLGTERYLEDLGTFRLTTRVAPVYVPPIGPENDPALIEEMRAEERDKGEWMLAAWQYVVVGDAVRLPGRPETEALVDFISTQQWHAKLSQYVNRDGELQDWAEPWKHDVIHVRLAGRAVPLDWPPAEPVEILMDFDRRAVFGVQQMFARKDES